MKKPDTIINKPLSLLSLDLLNVLSNLSWGNYTKENGWSNIVFSGRVIREWILNSFQTILSSITLLRNTVESNFSTLSNTLTRALTLELNDVAQLRREINSLATTVDTVSQSSASDIESIQETINSNMETFLENINANIQTLSQDFIESVVPSLNEGESLSTVSGQTSTSSTRNIEYSIMSLGGSVLGTFKSAAIVYTKAPDYFRLIIKSTSELTSSLLEESINPSTAVIHSKSFTITLGTNDFNCYVVLKGNTKSSVTGPLGASFTSLFIQLDSITKDGETYTIYHYRRDVAIDLTLTFNMQ